MGSLRRAENAHAFPLDNVITNLTWITFEDETVYGERPECPSDHIPVCVKCAYIRMNHIPIRFLDYSYRWLSDAEFRFLDFPLHCHMLKEVDLSNNYLTSVGFTDLRLAWKNCASLQK